MPQIFHRSTNFLSRVSIFGAVFFFAILLWLLYDLEASPYTTQQTIARDQPVQFSHAHHVGAIGIDCRYCHTSVEKAAFAGIPPTKTCMNCHSQIWAQSPYLEPVRASFRNDTSLEWTRVHDLPDFVLDTHPREQGCRLRDLPRARGPDAAHVPGGVAPDALVPGLPPQPREVPSSEGGGLHDGLAAADRTGGPR